MEGPYPLPQRGRVGCGVCQGGQRRYSRGAFPDEPEHGSAWLALVLGLEFPVARGDTAGVHNVNSLPGGAFALIRLWQRGPMNAIGHGGVDGLIHGDLADALWRLPRRIHRGLGAW